MDKIYLVTGNPNKLREIQAIFPPHVKLAAKELDLPEIQSLDSDEIINDKLDRAYALLKKPVIVEDVSAKLSCLNGLPGPFVKYFEKELGKGTLYTLAENYEDKSVSIRCTMGYYDGEKRVVVHGEIHGTVVPPRGENGFGFDFVFVPDGETRTTGEMSPEEKNKISHRAQAVNKLVAELFPEP